jgi:CBS domain-containing protein
MSSLLKGQLKARHIMSRQVTCLAGSTSVDDVKEIFESKRIRHILVKDRSDALVGIISHEDVHARSGKCASDIMTPKPYTLDFDSDVSIGITELICRRISCLPITSKDGGLKGIITKTDFLLALQCAIQTLGGVVNHLSPADDLKNGKHTVRKTTAQPSGSQSDTPAEVLTSA